VIQRRFHFSAVSRLPNNVALSKGAIHNRINCCVGVQLAPCKLRRYLVKLTWTYELFDVPPKCLAKQTAQLTRLQPISPLVPQIIACIFAESIKRTHEVIYSVAGRRLRLNNLWPPILLRRLTQ
jgi:hypothetical protein